MRKFLAALFIGCILFAASIPLNIWAMSSEDWNEYETECWDGVSVLEPTVKCTVNGISYYEIDNAAHLAYVAKNGGKWLGENYILTNDIVLNDVELICDVLGNLKIDPSGLNVWQPIDGFTGAFNGNGHSISGLYVKCDKSAGLFANVTGKVSNLVLKNIYVEGDQNVGGIAGYATDIVGCSVYGSVVGAGNVGGIAGDVSGADYVGGIVAYSDDCNVVKSYNVGNVTGSSHVGAVIGGCCQLLGANRGTVSNCYYLQNEAVNGSITAFGNDLADQAGVAEAKPAEFFPICVNSDSDPGYSFLGYAYIVDFVDRLYTNVLNRKADHQGKLNWVVTLKNGTNNGASLASIFFLGEEFALRNLSDEAYIEVLYRTFFGREADAGGMDNWMTHLQSGYSREYVLSKFVNLDEFTELCKMYGIERGLMFENGSVASLGVQNFVKRLYEKALGRESDTEGFYNWVCAIASKVVTADEAAMNFFGSQEYTLKNTNGETFVRDLYCVFMDREADAEGLAYWISCIEDYGMTRDWVAEQFADSYEFYLIMQNYGVN